MHQTKLADNTSVFCLRKAEAQVLDGHVEGYLQHGIALGPNHVVFDVGANIGIFGLRACQRYENLRIYAFEPIPAIYEVLKANASAYASRYHTFNCGLSNEEGQLDFVYFPNSPALSTAHPEDWERDPEEFSRAVAGALRTAPMWYARWIPSFLAGFIAKRLQAGAQRVRCPLRRLSEVLQSEKLTRIDLLKIDCEGAEWQVLQGIDAEDWPKIQQVVVEVHDVEGRTEKIKQLLISHGFTQIVAEQEAGFEQTNMINLFAKRT